MHTNNSILMRSDAKIATVNKNGISKAQIKGGFTHHSLFSL